MGLGNTLVALRCSAILILPEQRLQAWPIEQALGPRDALEPTGLGGPRLHVREQKHIADRGRIGQ